MVSGTLTLPKLLARIAKSLTNAQHKQLMAPPRKRSFDRKQFVPYLEKFSSDREIEKLFLEFLQERAKV